MPGTPVRRILIAPLDWGLGHTTRCIPLIRHLLRLKCEVVFAGNDVQKTFIGAAFPGIPCLDLPGYGVKYSAGRFLPNILRQIPKILRSIRNEHQWLLQTVEQEHIDSVISDNRYGLWHPRIPSVILSHQPGILSGLGSWVDALLRRLHYRMLQRFTQTWLVDTGGSPNLSGLLAHPGPLPPNARYIGWLSQLQPQHLRNEGYTLILLSGPEPQRTILADVLWQQARALTGTPIVFVEGNREAQREDIPPHIRHFSRATTSALQDILGGATMVVCRSGYSSLMDLARFRKPAILIPTPGQTEQEYLARKLHAEAVFFHQPQAGFDLKTALDLAERFPFHSIGTEADFRLYEGALNAL